jgi:hypothetical protein
MRTFHWATLSQRATRIAWALLFIALPVTSFPYFPVGMGGKTLVRPLSIYPLLILLILATIPRLLKRPLPRTFLPLFAFIVITIISSALAFTSGVEALRGVSMLSRVVRNIITLGLGGAFYLTFTLLPETWDDLDFSLRWLYAGFAIALLWGSLQALYVIHFSPAYFKMLNQLQSLVSTRKLFPTRISGLTYEPKWFAEQLCFMLLPWLLGAVLSKRSAFRWRFKSVTLEWLLLAWAIAILIFTYSRTGLIILGVLVFISFLLYRFFLPNPDEPEPINTFWAKFLPKIKRPRWLGSRRPSSTGEKLPTEKLPKKRGRKILEAALVAIALVVAFIFIGSQNTYVARFWRYWTEANKIRKRSYFEYIAVEQRIVYWRTALSIFDSHPLLGVGLGNYVFYFEEMLPDQPWFRQPEIVRQITPIEGRSQLITPKNMIARLLAETGLAGTIAFITFVLAIVGCVLFLWLSPDPIQKYWGMCGLFGLVVFSFVVLSYDSFALPNMWVFFGLMTAAAHIPDPSNPRPPQDPPDR